MKKSGSRAEKVDLPAICRLEHLKSELIEMNIPIVPGMMLRKRSFINLLCNPTRVLAINIFYRNQGRITGAIQGTVDSLDMDMRVPVEK